MLTIPDLNRLKVFTHVYEHRSIVKAADVLSITRSAVSQSLKLLEDEMNTTLFVRSSKKVVPTKTAEILYDVMSPFLQELQSALGQIETGRRTPHGHIRLGAPLDFGSDKLTEVISNFKKIYPAVTFELILGVPVRQLDLLCANKLDMAFIDNGNIFAKSYPISTDSIFIEEFVLVAQSKFYKKYIGSETNLSKLKELPLIDYLPHSPVLKMWFKHHFGKNLSDLKATYSAESVHAVLKAIGAGMGIGVVPKRLINSKTDLLIIQGKKQEFLNQISIAQSLDHKPSLAEKVFIEFCKTAF